MDIKESYLSNDHFVINFPIAVRKTHHMYYL
jgi:hypothetical protein